MYGEIFRIGCLSLEDHLTGTFSGFIVEGRNSTAFFLSFQFTIKRRDYPWN